MFTSYKAASTAPTFTRNGNNSKRTIYWRHTHPGHKSMPKRFLLYRSSQDPKPIQANHQSSQDPTTQLLTSLFIQAQALTTYSFHTLGVLHYHHSDHPILLRNPHDHQFSISLQMLSQCVGRFKENGHQKATTRG